MMTLMIFTTELNQLWTDFKCIIFLLSL